MSEQLIYGKMIDVMRDMEAIGKDRRNTQQGYNFRGIDDVYNLVQPILAKHGVVMSATILADSHEERPSKGGGLLIYRILKIRYSFIASDGSFVSTEVIGEGMDSGDKATNKAMSVAQKYALLQTFLIPTEDPKDPENDDPRPTTNAAGQVTKPAGQPPAEQKKPETPATEAQVKEIKDAASYLMDLIKKTEADIFATLQLKVKKQFARDIKAIDELTEPQATWVIKNLWKAIQSEGQKKIDEIAKLAKTGPTTVPPPSNDGAPGGPNDPGEGSDQS
jgi:hypothetical protein